MSKQTSHLSLRAFLVGFATSFKAFYPMRAAYYLGWNLTEVGAADRRLVYLRLGFLGVSSPEKFNFRPNSDFCTDRERLIAMVHGYSLGADSDWFDI